MALRELSSQYIRHDKSFFYSGESPVRKAHYKSLLLQWTLISKLPLMKSYLKRNGLGIFFIFFFNIKKGNDEKNKTSLPYLLAPPPPCTTSWYLVSTHRNRLGMPITSCGVCAQRLAERAFPVCPGQVQGSKRSEKTGCKSSISREVRKACFILHFFQEVCSF